MCGFNFKERKNNTDLRESLGLEPVSLAIRRSRLWQFGHVEHKDNADNWVKRRMMIQTERTREDV